MFGIHVKEIRLQKGFSLREFCRLLDEDASNWSKIEREKAPPPKDPNRLEKIAKLLGIEVPSKEWDDLFDMASVDAGAIPQYLMDDKEVLKALPVFFRTVGSIKPTVQELKRLIEKVREGI